MKTIGFTVTKNSTVSPRTAQCPQGPTAQEGTCTGRLKFVSKHLNDSEKAWEKVLWSELFGINLTHSVWRKRQLTHRTPTPQSSTAMETLCFRAVYVLRVQESTGGTNGQGHAP